MQNVVVKTRMQLENELYQVIVGQDIRPMKKAIFDVFKKKSLDKLSNEQLEIIIPVIKTVYAKSSIPK